MTSVDVQMITRALLTTDAQRRMFETSSTFRFGIEQIARVAASAVIGLEIQAPAADAELDQRIRDAKTRRPGTGMGVAAEYQP